MLIVTSLLKPDATALLPRQHRVRRPTPATALTPRQYRWRRRPRRDGSVDHVALASSLSAARLGSENYFLLAFLRVFRALLFGTQKNHTIPITVEHATYLLFVNQFLSVVPPPKQISDF
jgi:hypothetical protein